MCGAGNEARQRNGGYRASLQALRENQERNYRELQEAIDRVHEDATERTLGDYQAQELAGASEEVQNEFLNELLILGGEVDGS